MSSGSSTITMPSMAYDHGLSPAQGLSSSFSSVTDSPASRSAASQVAKVYRQASALFLTRRLPEALATISTVILPPSGFDSVNGDLHEPALVATCSRNSRIKAWSLYLTLIDSIVNMSPEEGKAAFGTQVWRELVAKVRDGKIWSEVVNRGYGGHDGDVDPEIVVNLSTLLLSHSPSQAFNQQQLENYLSATMNPNLDISGMIDTHESNVRPHSNRRRSQNGGTNTPQDLNSRIKILELYTLHVLPRNEEWDYAREFLKLSEILDEERREMFLQTLQNLQEDKLVEVRAEREREDQLQREKREAQARKAEEAALLAKQAATPQDSTAVGSNRKKSPTSETDYGIDSARPRSTPRPNQKSSRPSSAPSRTGRPGSKSIIKQASDMMASLQQVISSIASSSVNNRISLVKLLLFIAALAATLGSPDVRGKLNAVLSRVWEKVKATLGMGVKVSYI